VKFLFATDGYPGFEGTKSGSGIGTFLAGLADGLSAKGHECHILTWGDAGAPASQMVGGVRVHLVTRGYWRLRDRLIPGWHDVAARRAAARALDHAHRFDWIEVESDEGVDIGIQRDFPKRTILRVHTTLNHMVAYKKTRRSRSARSSLDRERRSILLAPRLVVSTAEHGAELSRLFPGMRQPTVLPLGLKLGDGEQHRAYGGAPPEFLVVGTPDLRKGFDRIRPVLESYARRYGPCRCAIVSDCGPASRARFGLLDPLPSGIDLSWHSGLSDGEMSRRYRESSVLLHLARYESYGYPPIEAAARSTPVVATRAGIAPSLLRGEWEHLLVDGDDPDECSRALDVAVKEARRIGLALRDRFEREFSQTIAIDKYLEYLGQIDPRGDAT